MSEKFCFALLFLLAAISLTLSAGADEVGGIKNDQPPKLPNWCDAEFFAIVNITRTEAKSRNKSGGIRRLYFYLKEEFGRIAGVDRGTLTDFTFINNPYNGTAPCNRRLKTGVYLVGGRFYTNTEEPYLTVGECGDDTFAVLMNDLSIEERTFPLEKIRRACTYP